MAVRSFQQNRVIRRIASVLGVTAIAGGFLVPLGRVISGHGADPYRTVWGLEARPVQALATLVVVVAFFGALWAVRGIRKGRK
jgi:hypothetical protein